MVNRDEGNGGNGSSSSDHDHPPTQEPVGNSPGRVAGAEYYRRTLLERLERDRKEYARLSRRLYHNGRVILEAWASAEFEGEAGGGKLTLEELEMWEDLWIALWRKRRRLSRTIKALTKEIAEIDGPR